MVVVLLQRKARCVEAEPRRRRGRFIAEASAWKVAVLARSVRLASLGARPWFWVCVGDQAPWERSASRAAETTACRGVWHEPRIVRWGDGEETTVSRRVWGWHKVSTVARS